MINAVLRELVELIKANFIQATLLLA